jgi:hypothetical protein
VSSLAAFFCSATYHAPVARGKPTGKRVARPAPGLKVFWFFFSKKNKRPSFSEEQEDGYFLAAA